MNSRVEILITNQDGVKEYLDINVDEIGIPLNYSIDDVRKIESKNANFSKNFKLPATKKNNDIFGNLFDINVTFDEFNPNKRIDATILQDSIPLLRGYLQLKSIDKNNNTDLQGGDMYYNVIVFDGAVDFFQSLGDEKLEDMDLSEFNHPYNKDSIENAWNNHTFQDIYQYPLLDKDITGYVYDDFKPFFYSKGILLRIAEEKGYTLEGDFIENDELFERELYSWDGSDLTLTLEEQFAREFSAEFVAPNALFQGNDLHRDASKKIEGRRRNLNFNNIVFDNTGNFTTDNIDPNPNFGDYSEWIAPKDGEYDFTILANFRIDYNKNGNTLNLVEQGGVIIQPPNYPKPVVIIKIYDVDTQQPIAGASAASILDGGLFLPLGGSPQSTGGDGLWSFNNIFLKEGQKILFTSELSSDRAFAWGTTTQVGSGFPTVVESLDVYFSPLLSTGVQTQLSNTTSAQQIIPYNSELNLNLFIPKNIEKSKFFGDIIKRYNLYVSTNPNKNRTLILETRNVYYRENTVLDWTDKKDNSKRDEIKFLTELQKKNVLFTYAEDSGQEGYDGVKWLEEYNKKTGDIYGQEEITFNNDFLKGQLVIQSIFSSSPLLFRQSNNVVVPSFSPLGSKRKSTILYWGGFKEVRDRLNTPRDLIIDWDGTIETYSEYPFGGHFDDPYSPSIDIHFGQTVFEWTGSLENITDNNLYNRYWKNYIEQISEGKMLVSNFYLSASDINIIKDNLNYRIFIKDSYYVINRIIDYNPLKNTLTKVELLKIKKGVDFTPQQLVNSEPILTPTNTSPTTQSNYGPFLSSINNRINTPSFMVLGTNNFVGVNSNGTINGNNNSVGANSQNVNITGNNNIVSSNVSNVQIIGDNHIVTESNLAIINNTTIRNDSSIESRSGTVTIEGVPFSDGEIFTGLWERGDGEDSLLQVNNSNPNISDGDFSVVTGSGNITNGLSSSVIGGVNNTVTTGDNSSILGGNNNDVTGDKSSILGGTLNVLAGEDSSILGGDNNTVTGDDSSIVGGSSNDVTGDDSSILGGSTNRVITGYNSSIIGGNNNTVTGDDSSIVGGSSNDVTGDNSSILGGFNNTLNGGISTIISGLNNNLNAIRSAIIGGLNNDVTGDDSSILGGSSNTLNGGNSTIISGVNNNLNANRSAIIGGNNITSTLDDCVTVPSISFATDTTKKWVFKEIEIGDWDIVTTNGVTVPHGLSVSEWKTIRSVSVIIRNDADTVYFDFDFTIYSTFIGLTRANNSSFINPNFVLTPYNRGWITFWYRPD